MVLVGLRLVVASSIGYGTRGAQGLRAARVFSVRVTATSSSAIVPTVDPRRWSARLVDIPAEGNVVGGVETQPVEVVVVPKRRWTEWFAGSDEQTRGWLTSVGRQKFKDGEVTLVPSADGAGLSHVVVAANATALYALSSLPSVLPAGRKYALAASNELDTVGATTAALSWALGCYEFDCLKAPRRETEARPVLVWPEACDRAAVERTATATFLCRDLITMPCEQMGPADLEQAARDLATEHGASVESVVGEALLDHNFPSIHAVGRAAGPGREPRLIDLRWGSGARKVTLVGKGVCFDTGGLDIKPSSAMLTMKKDMGGAAHALGLAHMVMAAGLDCSLRVLLPIVENSISGGSFRPGDVLVARNGKTTEVGNTDAEGRLILSDALVLACEESPDLVIDMATLTGASRVALGTDVPSIFSNDDHLARELQDMSAAVQDQVWHLPLWEPYRAQLKSTVADLKNVGAGAYGGAITAALYLSEFVGKRGKPVGSEAFAEDEDEGQRPAEDPRWVHMDVMAYNTKNAPGRPEGGEAMGLRAFFALIHKHYAKGG